MGLIAILFTVEIVSYSPPGEVISGSAGRGGRPVIYFLSWE